MGRTWYVGSQGRDCAMTIHLSKDLEKIVHGALLAGHYASEEEVIRDALIRLLESAPQAAEATGKKAKRTKQAKQKKPLTSAELDQYMLDRGLLSQLPDINADFD